MLWMQIVCWAVFAVAWAQQEQRWRGEAGRQRLLELDAFQAGALQSAYRSPWPTRLWVVAAAFFLVGAVAFAVDGDWLGLAAALVCAAAMLFAGWSRRRTAPHVLAVLAERDLSSEGRETSRRRRLRIRQYGAAALVSAVVGLPLLVQGLRHDSAALTIAGTVLLALGAVALAGLAWATAWRYGDEQPAPES